ncbi:MAG: SDR family NAD(P)-dependent oxidoreductase [Alphaproteobacteria bacterium]|nr:SDR family NAD(P)-dependent oxidoreductase [Alphaproteobacteria bacterium]
MTDAEKDGPVCLVTGVGAGTGASTVRRFATGGYRVAMNARNAERLEAMAAEVPGTRAYPCDVADLDALVAMLDAVRDEMGPIEVVVHNAVGGGWVTFLEADPDLLERNFRINTTALFYIARAVVPAMIEAGRGAIVATGNTAAHRGKAHTPIFAPSKAAQRILAQSLDRDLGPKGVHVAYVTIDAMIDQPRTRPLLAPDKPDEFFSKPDAIAEEIWHVVHQDRSAWSFDVEVRPYGEVW